jgi:hypothetical protein
MVRVTDHQCLLRHDGPVLTIQEAQNGKVGCWKRRKPSSRSKSRTSSFDTALLATVAHCYRYEHGINTFDTANVSSICRHKDGSRSYSNPWAQVYSYGRSEEILGSAIKQLSMPRGEIVVMTKVPPIASDVSLCVLNIRNSRCSLPWEGLMTRTLSITTWTRWATSTNMV